MAYVSITGLRLKSPFHAPLFWLYAARAFPAAQSNPGCLRAQTATIEGVHHTLTVWESRKAAMAYVRGAEHKAAIKIYARVDDPSSKTYGFETDTPPATGDAARAIWDAHGRVYAGS